MTKEKGRSWARRDRKAETKQGEAKRKIDEERQERGDEK
jgi:hypothetical protein